MDTQRHLGCRNSLIFPKYQMTPNKGTSKNYIRDVPFWALYIG